MHKLLALAVLIGVPAAVHAQPSVVTVQLSNFKYSPAVLQLRSGVPTTLRLQNASGGGHNFTAPEFFAGARIDPKSAAFVHDGRVEVPGRSTVEINLVPAAGTYRLKCTHTLHSTFGMKGTISVR